MAFRDRIRATLHRLLAHLLPGRADLEIEAEVRFHIERQAERNLAAGMNPAEALLAARRDFGNVGATQDAMRDALQWGALSRLERDVRYAIRSLRRAPTFGLAVIGTVALALGLNATVFTIFNAYVLRPLAVRDPTTLYDMRVTGEGGWHETWVDWPQYDAVAHTGGPVAETVASRLVYVRIDRRPALGELVSGNYFEALGVRALFGRTLLPDDARVPGAGAVIVLGYRAWQTWLGGDRAVVGRTISIRGVPFTVVGVLPPTFTGVRELAMDFWAPVTVAHQMEGTVPRPDESLLPRVATLVRLRDGASPDAAASLIAARLARSTADGDPARRISDVTLTPRTTAMPLDAEMAAVFAPIAVGFLLVLVIACANVANMMLARGLARQRELGIRMALGAGRRHVIGQLLTEALVLVVPAAILGWLLSRVTLDLCVRWMVATFPPAFASSLRMIELSPDVRVFGFMALIAIGAAVLFGLAPAVQVTRTNVVVATRGELDAGWRHARLRNLLVMAQMAACLLLLVAAGVLLRGAGKARAFDTGLRTAGVVQIELNDATRERALAELRRMPQVREIAASSDHAAAGSFNRVQLRVAGSDTVMMFRYNRVSADYFAMLGIGIVAGRTFSADETRDGLPVVILSETAARRVAPNGDAVGREIQLPGDAEALRWTGLTRFRTARVVGIAGDAIAGMIFLGRHTPVAYFPLAPEVASARLLLQASGAIDVTMRDIEETLDRVVPGSVNEIYAVEQALETQIYPVRAASWVAALLGAVALLLTLSGIYGVLAYVVAQRTREIGVRIALGAAPSAVVGIVVRQSLRLASIGGAIGLILAFAVSLLFASQMEIVSVFDPLAYLGGTAAAIGACLVAAWIPARRAASVSPLDALRGD